MFLETLKRDPTDVECFDLAQSNSEHSRHWFFGGQMTIDGEKKEQTLFQMVKATMGANPKIDHPNSVIAFHDNSSAITGYPVTALLPQTAGQACAMVGLLRYLGDKVIIYLGDKLLLR